MSTYHTFGNAPPPSDPGYAGVPSQAGGPANNKTKNGFGSGATINGPSLGVNVNINKPQSGGVGAAGNPGQGVTRNNQYALPEPAFYSAADVHAYCNALRSFAAYCAIEIEVGAEILKAALENTGLNGDKPWDAKLRARKVSQKIAKAGADMADAAAKAAGAWALFQREYSDVLSQRHQPGGGPQRRPFTFD